MSLCQMSGHKPIALQPADAKKLGCEDTRPWPRNWKSCIVTPRCSILIAFPLQRASYLLVIFSTIIECLTVDVLVIFRERGSLR